MIYVVINNCLMSKWMADGGVWEQRAEESNWELQGQKVTSGIKRGD